MRQTVYGIQNTCCEELIQLFKCEFHQWVCTTKFIHYIVKQTKTFSHMMMYIMLFSPTFSSNG